jgi:DNA-binding beta-propeller fold protein YncE
MENLTAPAIKEKRAIRKKEITIIVLIILLLQIILFAYLFWAKKDLVDLVYPKYGFGGPPKSVFGIYGTDTPMRRPMGVTVYDRKVFVTDNGMRNVRVFDYDGNPLFSFGGLGTEPGKFTFPYGIVADKAGQIYVSDLQTGKISIFGQDGKFIKYFADGSFKGPSGLFIFDDQLFVTDVNKSNVSVFKLDGTKVFEFGTKGSGEGEMLSPNFVTATKDFIYVSDTGNNRVLQFDRSGKYLKTNIGGVPEGSKTVFTNTRGVWVDEQGVLYVVSNLTNTVFGFDKDGKRLWTFGTLGQEDDQFYLPNALYIDSQGRIYIADTLNARVMVYEY